MNKLWWRWDGGKTDGVLFAVGGEIMTSDSMITMCGCVCGGGGAGEREWRWAWRSRGVAVLEPNLCYIGIDLDLSKPKGMPFDLKLHTYSFTTKYINVAKA